MGVDPSNIGSPQDSAFQVIRGFFPSDDVLKGLGSRRFNIVTTIATFYTADAPVQFAAAVEGVLADGGVWVLELSYLPSLLSLGAFDSICHEHVAYYDLRALKRVLERAGLKVLRCKRTGINGGSVLCHVGRVSDQAQLGPHRDSVERLVRVESQAWPDYGSAFEALWRRAEGSRRELVELLRMIKRSAQRIHVYGSSTKGNVLLQWCDIDSTLIECAAERDPGKRGLFTPGTGIPIVDEATSRALRPDYYLVLPWHFRREILAREAGRSSYGVNFIFPFPKLEVVSGSARARG